MFYNIYYLSSQFIIIFIITNMIIMYWYKLLLYSITQYTQQNIYTIIIVIFLPAMTIIII